MKKKFFALLLFFISISSSYAEIKRIISGNENAKITMKNFEDAVKKVREQKDLKITQKVELSAFR